MSINYRQEVAAVYDNSPSWVAKLKRMSDNQVFAIFSRLRTSGKIKI